MPPVAGAAAEARERIEQGWAMPGVVTESGCVGQRAGAGLDTVAVSTANFPHVPGGGRGPLGASLTERSASVLRPFLLGPGLRRGGVPSCYRMFPLVVLPRRREPGLGPHLRGETRLGQVRRISRHHPGGGRGPSGKVAITTRCAQLATSPNGPRPPPGTCGKFAVDTTSVSSPAPARCPTHPLSVTTPGMARPCSIRPRASAAAPATGGISSVDRTLASVCTSYTSLSTRD